MKKSHPFPFILFGSVVALTLSFSAYKFGGTTALFVTISAFNFVVGVAVGRSWTIYPWQAGLIAGIPGIAFLFWRFITASDPMEASVTSSQFSFLPMISIISCYFGAYIGRWLAIRKKRSAANEERQ